MRIEYFRYITYTYKRRLAPLRGEDIQATDVSRSLDQVKEYKGVRLREEREALQAAAAGNRG